MFLGDPSIGFMGNSDSSLLSAVASTCFDLDTTLLTSYGGSGQTWSNLANIPNDSSSKTSYDFYRGDTSGTDTSDPTFNGTPGSQNTYWSYPTSQQFFTLKGSNTAFLNGLAKTSGGGKGWYVFSGQTPVGNSVSDPLFFGTTFMGTIRADTAPLQYGMLIDTTNGVPRIITQSLAGLQDSVSSGTTLPSLTNLLMIVSWDLTLTTNNVRFWINNRSKTTKSFAPASSITDASNKLYLSSDVAPANEYMPNGWKTRGMAMGNAFIDDVDADKIIDFINLRHGITYV